MKSDRLRPEMRTRTRRGVDNSARNAIVRLADVLEQLRSSGQMLTISACEAFTCFTFLWDAANPASGKKGARAKVAAGLARALRDQIAPPGFALRLIIDRLYPLPEPGKKVRKQPRFVAPRETEI